jgi:cytochrome c oxidase subunit 2
VSPFRSAASEQRSARRRPSRRRASLAIVAGFVVLAVSGCSQQDVDQWRRLGFPEPATEQAPRILTLWQGSWTAAIAVGLVVWGLVVWSSIFHRKKGEDLPPQVRYNVPIEAIYTVVPFIIILVLFYFTARDESELRKLHDDPDVTVNAVGKRWSWDFNYLDENVYVTGTPGEPPTLVLPESKRVRFQLTSPDVIHSFWVPAWLFKLDVIPGRTNEFEVTPDKQGTFAGKCAELCGLDHARMLFSVRVVSATEYDAFIQSLRDRGQTGKVTTGVARSGVSEEAAAGEGSEQ